MIGLALDMFRYPYQKDYSYDRHKDVIKKLKFISRIEPGERINVSSVSTANNNLFSSIYRSIFKEGRAKTFQFLNDVIDRSFELVVLYQESQKMSDKITCAHIFEDLLASITGLKNLQTTYSEDRNFYCEVETLIGSIFARLAEFYDNESIYIAPQTKEKIRNIIIPNFEDKQIVEKKRDENKVYEKKGDEKKEEENKGDEKKEEENKVEEKKDKKR